ncbi:MAG: GNAT family N-acetyltransferase [Acidimicrobiales bacterium]
MSADPDKVARASRAWKHLIEAVPGGWVRRAGGALGVVTGVRLSGFNGVWSASAHVDEVAVVELLDDVAAAGVPYCMQLRPGWPKAIEELAKHRGLVRVPGEPVMVLEDDSKLAAAQPAGGLLIRELAPTEGHLHAAVAARGFEQPEGPYRELMTSELLGSRGMRCYVGEVNGQAVTTCIAVRVDECVSIFGVATLPAYRAKGYGAAVTSRAVSDGLAHGAEWAWLSSSKAAFGVYTRLGFTTLEHWDSWESHS